MKKTWLLLVGLVMGISAVQAQDIPMFILFPANSSSLESVGTEQAIENNDVFTEVARLLAEDSRRRVLVDGHANPVIGTVRERAILVALGQKRAEAAADFLVRYYNINRNRIIISNAGGTLAEPGRSQAYMNRRVNFFVLESR